MACVTAKVTSQRPRLIGSTVRVPKALPGPTGLSLAFLVGRIPEHGPGKYLVFHTLRWSGPSLEETFFTSGNSASYSCCGGAFRVPCPTPAPQTESCTHFCTPTIWKSSGNNREPFFMPPSSRGGSPVSAIPRLRVAGGRAPPARLTWGILSPPSPPRAQRWRPLLSSSREYLCMCVCVCVGGAGGGTWPLLPHLLAPSLGRSYSLIMAFNAGPWSVITKSPDSSRCHKGGSVSKKWAQSVRLQV